MSDGTVAGIAATVFAMLLAGCASTGEPRCAPGERNLVNDLLYFGTARPNGVVTTDEWAQFLAGSVTSRFPQGLTVWQASGQWRDAGGAVVREPAYVLNLVNPGDERHEAGVRAIAAEYRARFDQEAVLRVKSHVCASP